MVHYKVGLTTQEWPTGQCDTYGARFRHIEQFMNIQVNFSDLDADKPPGCRALLHGLNILNTLSTRNLQVWLLLLLRCEGGFWVGMTAPLRFQAPGAAQCLWFHDGFLAPLASFGSFGVAGLLC